MIKAIKSIFLPSTSGSGTLNLQDIMKALFIFFGPAIALVTGPIIAWTQSAPGTPLVIAWGTVVKVAIGVSVAFLIKTLATPSAADPTPLHPPTPASIKESN